MAILRYAIIIALGTTSAWGKTQYGFVGYGVSNMQPFCAQACRDSISGASLNCSTVQSMSMSDSNGVSMDMGPMGPYSTRQARSPTIHGTQITTTIVYSLNRKVCKKGLGKFSCLRQLHKIWLTLLNSDDAFSG
jgi:hypothetical protein